MSPLLLISHSTGPHALTTEVIRAIGWAVVIAATCYAVTIDVRVRRIPNNLTLPLWICGMIWGLASGGFNGLADSLLGMAVAGLPFFMLWIIGGGGAGDAKMMFAIGAWLGLPNAFVTIIAVGVAGGILSLVYAFRHGRLVSSVMNTVWMMVSVPFVVLGPGRLQDKQRVMPASADQPLKTPYSVAMLMGTVAAAIWVYTCGA